MKIIITGASGLLGRAIFKELNTQKNWTIRGLAYSRADQYLTKMDLTNQTATEKYLTAEKPQFLIHCAAERNPDICENNSNKTNNINVTATESLAKICGEINCKLIYISTDYVFDGTQPPYSTDTKPNPLNKYGVSKLAGEEAAMRVNPQSIILRVPVLYGPTKDLNESAVTTILTALRTNPAQQFDHWAVRYPTNTTNIAIALNSLIKKIINNNSTVVKGPYHFSAPESLTKYEMAKILAELSGIDSKKITANHSEPSGAPRPKNCQLDCSSLKLIIKFPLQNFKSDVEQIIKNL